MKNRSWILVVFTILAFTFVSSHVVEASAPSLKLEVQCTPFQTAQNGFNIGLTCSDAGDVVVTGGYDCTAPMDVATSTFLFTGTIANGWQAVGSNPSPTTPAQCRVCISCTEGTSTF